MGASREVEPESNSIILFDGVCNLCSASVQFIIKRDPKKKFQFASLQSEVGQNFLGQFSIDKQQLHSIILIQNDQYFEQSEAALRIAKQLNGAWPLLYAFKILPQFIRDLIYRSVARNRYHFFGKRDSCWIPTPELKSRFID
jgi:predicted DCC family thiol-disulfide oxidoreductase YuxK